METWPPSIGRSQSSPRRGRFIDADAERTGRPGIGLHNGGGQTRRFPPTARNPRPGSMRFGFSDRRVPGNRKPRATGLITLPRTRKYPPLIIIARAREARPVPSREKSKPIKVRRAPESSLVSLFSLVLVGLVTFKWPETPFSSRRSRRQLVTSP